MKRLNKIILSALIIGGTLFTNSNAQDHVYKMYTKSMQKSSINQDLPKEVQADLNSLNNIKYLEPKTNSNYEIAQANSDGTYTYLSSSQDLQLAISQAKSQKTKTTSIPVVINSDGLVVYATEGIGRVIKVVNGTPVNTFDTIANIYKTSELKSPEHTYINHAFIDDVPILESDGVSSKVEVAGYTGYIKNFEADNSQNIVVVPLNQAYGLSYYSTNSQGELVHYISSDVTTANQTSPQVLGPAPDYIKSGTKYYSYDGNYFYTDINQLIEDAKSNNHNNSVNLNNPYYNYYQYLPGRSKTSYTAQDINAYFEKNTSANSVLRNTGEYFIKAQEQYGVNALMSIGIAMNESNNGTSNIALTKNNIFGANATDLYPQGADKFTSVEECIMSVSNNFISNGYFNPKSWKYNGSALGNKEFGANVRYASDPYWGEKATRNMYQVDKSIGGRYTLKDYNRYLLGMFSNPTIIKTTSNKDLYSILSKGTRNPSQPAQGEVGDTTIVLVNNNGNYQIRPDRIVGINETNINGDGTYLWDVFGVVSQNNVQLINTVANIETDFANNWAKDYITDAMYKGWVDTTNTFNPEGFIKRAEFVKIVNRAFNLTEAGTENFDDVNPSEWFYKDVCIAVKAGYINGRNQNTFAPNDLITRQEAAKIVGIMLGIKNDSDVVTSFSDDNKIENWADGYVKGLADRDILNGYGEDNTFRPNNSIKRGESVKILSLARR